LTKRTARKPRASRCPSKRATSGTATCRHRSGPAVRLSRPRPLRPREGLRFNSNKLLLDPYARSLSGAVDWKGRVFAYRLGSRTEDLTRDVHNSARSVPKSVVVSDEFDWGDDTPPHVPWPETVIYEHTSKASPCATLTCRDQRGKYLGVASPPIIEHLKSLGVTAVELLPIHHFIDETFLLDRGLRNYWGYQSLGYFAATPRYATADRGQQATEFKQMVKALHAAGLEVSSTSSTTTPPKAITSVRHSHFGASPTRRTTTWSPRTGATIATSRAPATRSTWRTRKRSN